jgi:hypothetical protein
MGREQERNARRLGEGESTESQEAEDHWPRSGTEASLIPVPAQSNAAECASCPGLLSFLL